MCWSKTIQYLNRTLLVPVPKIDHSRLCPHRAIVHAFKVLAEHDSAKLGNGPAFVYTSGDQVKPITYTTFTTKLKSCLSNLNLTAPSTLDTLFVAEEPPLRWTVESTSMGTTSRIEIGFLTHMNDISILLYSIRLSPSTWWATLLLTDFLTTSLGVFGEHHVRF